MGNKLDKHDTLSFACNQKQQGQKKYLRLIQITFFFRKLLNEITAKTKAIFTFRIFFCEWSIIFNKQDRKQSDGFAY